MLFHFLLQRSFVWVENLWIFYPHFFCIKKLISTRLISHHHHLY
ncbi:hypothetical protein D931_01529 [Enterococcus faecium 13.SD.W.09]|nr:hypothetical protein D931_01529 [Enterococcus faecium 13.SD.W.09]